MSEVAATRACNTSKNVLQKGENRAENRRKTDVRTDRKPKENRRKLWEGKTPLYPQRFSARFRLASTANNFADGVVMDAHRMSWGRPPSNAGVDHSLWSRT